MYLITSYIFLCFTFFCSYSMGIKARCTVTDLVRINIYKNDWKQDEVKKSVHLNTPNKYGETPFSIILADKSEKEFVKWLIKNGGDITKDYPSMLPLFHPLKSCDQELVAFFLEHGAKTHNPANPMHHSLLFAINNLHRKLPMIADKNQKNEYINKSIQCMDLILKAGCSLEPSDDLYTYPSCLHRAIRCGLYPIVNLLLRYGSDVYAKRCESDAIDIAKKIKEKYNNQSVNNQKKCAHIIIKWHKKLLKIEKINALNKDPDSYYSYLPPEVMELLVPLMKYNLGMLPDR